MPVVLKRQPPIVTKVASHHPLVHLAWFCAAGVFVSILLMTYGLDLSPGLF